MGKGDNWTAYIPTFFLLSACFHVDALSLPSLKLTARFWKLMVGSDDILFGKPALFSGANLLFSFQGIRRFLLPQLHQSQESGGSWFLERLGRLGRRILPPGMMRKTHGIIMGFQLQVSQLVNELSGFLVAINVVWLWQKIMWLLLIPWILLEHLKYILFSPVNHDGSMDNLHIYLHWFVKINHSCR